MESSDLKAEELRIGNIIADKEGGTKRVTHMVIENIVLGDNGWIGLLLTEDILIKAGFEQKDMADLGIATYLEIHPEIGLSWDINLNDNIWIGEYDTGIKYLHQLQNLFYSLTGQELTIEYDDTP